MSTEFKNILVGFDNSASSQMALQKAIDTAERFDADLTVVYVVDDKDDQSETIRTYLEDIQQKRSVKIEYLLKKGRIYKEVSQLEREIGADLIVIGSHGVTGWQPFWVGSNAFRIVSSSNCPVITIQETTKSYDLQDILLPLADSSETRQKVPYAITLAKAFNATVHILGVSKDDDNSTLIRVRNYMSQTEKYLHDHGIKTTSKESFGVKVPERCIEYAKEIRAGLIMIMTETESSGFFMDTYAQQLVNHSPIPVMSIHSRDLRVAGSVGY
jgi:nucleotide-binding universal stress UspA family protein